VYVYFDFKESSTRAVVLQVVHGTKYDKPTYN